MNGWEKIQALLQSRKFWALVTAIVAAGAALATQQIDTWQFIMAVVASLAAFSGGVAIEDAGQKMGAGLANQQPAPEVLKDLNSTSDHPVNEVDFTRKEG